MGNQTFYPNHEARILSRLTYNFLVKICYGNLCWLLNRWLSIRASGFEKRFGYTAKPTSLVVRVIESKVSAYLGLRGPVSFEGLLLLKVALLRNSRYWHLFAGTVGGRHD